MRDSLPERLPADQEPVSFNGDSAHVAATSPPDPKIAELFESYLVNLTEGIRGRFGNGPPDPEDVAQQAFHQLIERGDLGSISNLKAYLWRIARNIVLTAKRSQHVRTRYEFEVERILFPQQYDELTPERVILAKEQLKLLNKLLRNMPNNRRQAVVLHRVEGLTVAEVGRRLGISRQSAAMHLARGIADLSVAFLEHTEGSSDDP
ncbi:MAG: sigma-70 family RNA polymerase sigma factor [Pseudomonadota bacterium]